MEEMTPQSQETTADKAKRWFQDNLRIIISVVIVIVIAGGIYSYSKRTTDVAVIEENSQEEQMQQDQATVEIEGEEQTSGEVSGTQNQAAQSQVPVSKETESSFVESAGSGDGVTHLARRALANYLEKNPNSELTKEHKIYIEDYLRKNVGFQESVNPGTTVEFSKDLIQNAIEQSKNLTERQLKNLEKYSALVTSLS